MPFASTFWTGVTVGGGARLDWRGVFAAAALLADVGFASVAVLLTLPFACGFGDGSWSLRGLPRLRFVVLLDALDSGEASDTGVDP